MKNKKKSLRLTFVVVSVMLIAVPVQAATVLISSSINNGSFETTTGWNIPDFFGITEPTIKDLLLELEGAHEGSSALVFGPDSSGSAESASLSLASDPILNGVTINLSAFIKTSLDANETFDYVFILKFDGSNSITLANGTVSTLGVWEEEVALSFEAPNDDFASFSTATLVVDGTYSGNVGSAGIDSITLSVGEAIPEPSSSLLVVLGATVIGFRRKR